MDCFKKPHIEFGTDVASEQSLTGQSPAISEAKHNLILIEDRSKRLGFNWSVAIKEYVKRIPLRITKNSTKLTLTPIQKSRLFPAVTKYFKSFSILQ